MRASTLSRFALSFVAASTMLAACTSSPSFAPASAIPSATSGRAAVPIAGGRVPNVALPSAEHSWMAPNASKQQLLYLSDQTSDSVYVFSYPYDKLLGALSVPFPQGLCTDAAGDVFVTEFSGQAIREYAHGSITPKATLKDPGYKPVSCTIDSTTGNLAVGNLTSYSGSNLGNVAIYKGATGNPIAYYSAPSLAVVFFCGYDSSGNLFVDGESSASTFDMAELQKGKKALSHVSLNQSIVSPGGVQWDGRYLAVGDLSNPVIYRFAITGTKGTRIGTVSLTGAGQVVQFWIQSSRVVGPDFKNVDVGIWSYPGGGAALKVLTGFAGPFGATVSTVKT